MKFNRLLFMPAAALAMSALPVFDRVGGCAG